MPKFFVTDAQINNEIITITGADVNHIANVLRMKEGDPLVITNIDQNISYKTYIQEIQKEKIQCKIESKLKETTEPSIAITIFQGLPKAEKMEYIIQKTTEIGVKHIVPVAMQRCIVKLSEKDFTKKRDRWQKIAEVAAKQSGRDHIPQIGELTTVKNISDIINSYNLFLVAYENERNKTLKHELQQLYRKTNVENTNLKIAVLIGPEGGITEKEIEELCKAGAKVITLGKRILRTETAPIAIASNIIYEFEM